MDIIIIGSGGHAKVVKDLAEQLNYKIVAVCDPNDSNKNMSFWKDIKFYEKESDLKKYDVKKVYMANGIGHKTKNNLLRKKLFILLKRMGFTFPALIHPAAYVSKDSKLHDGVQVMAGSIVQPGCIIKENTIINTSCSIDHDCKIGSDVHIAPGSILCGNVHVGNNAFIGVGSKIIQGLSIKDNTFVKAGSLITHEIKGS
jgi:sugar O-acyltransferase (sialic acid O-acetyltransferase NeuD family)